MLKKKIAELEEHNKKFEELLNGQMNVSTIDPDALKNKVDISSLEKLKDELLNTLVNKEDFNLLQKRVEFLEETSSRLNELQEKTDERLKAIEKQLQNKVNCDQFDYLRALVNQLRAAGNKSEPAPPIPMISSEELNRIKDISDKLAEMEARLDSLSQ
jgi:flagellar capping protein FliD